MKISKGDVIINSKPYAYVLNQGLNEIRCGNCLLRRETLKRCSGCGFAHFCDIRCQKASWTDHKFECSSLKKVHPRIPPPHVLLIARIIRKLKRERATSENIGPISRQFSDLLSHGDEIKSDSHRSEGFMAAYFVLSQFLDEVPSRDDVFEIFGKVLINSVCIRDECSSIAAGLYLGPSVFNHSCQPTVLFVFNGPTLTVKSLVDLPDFDLSKLFINYIDLTAVTETRRKQLQEQYYFHCVCTKCNDSDSDILMTSILCQNKDCSHSVCLSDSICSKCGEKINSQIRFDADEISNLLNKMTEALTTKIESEPEKVIAELEPLVNNGRHLLHPLNIYFMKATYAVFEACEILENYSKALKYGVEVLNFVRNYYHEQDYLMWHLKRLGRIHYELGLFKEASKFLIESYKGLRFYYDENSTCLLQIAQLINECHGQLKH